MKLKIIIFLVIAIVGVGLRLIGVGNIQPVNSDEASYLRQARFMTLVARHFVGVKLPIVDESAEGIWRYLRHDDWSEKPCWLHTGFVAIAMLMGGVSAISGVMVNVVFSLGAVLVMFFLVRRFGGEFAAIISSLLLSISGYWLIYSRSNWAEVDGVFFVLLSVYLLICAVDRNDWKHSLLIFVGGVCGGIAVLCHYRLFYIIAPVGVTALLVGGKRRWFTNGFLVVVGYSTVLFTAAGVIQLIVGGIGGDMLFSGLLGAIGERYFPTEASGHVAQTGFQPLNSLAFIYYILRNQGVCAFILMLIGVPSLIMMHERRVVGVGLTSFLMIPLLILSMQEWVVARAGVVMVPFACIAVGVGVASFWEYVKRREGVVQKVVFAVFSILLVGMIVENLLFDSRLLGNKYGSTTVAEFFDEHPAEVVYADPESAITYGWFSPDLPYKKLDMLDKNNITHNAYVVFDSQKYHAYPASVKYVTELEAKCRDRGELVFKVENMTTIWREFLMDGTQAHSLMEMLQSVALADINDITSIRIYKLNK